MANLKAIKNRISSVKNIKKIAGALEVVAMTRLRRMERETLTARGYFAKIRELLFDVASNVNFVAHPFFEEKHAAKSVGVITVFSDKGLCGNFNNSVAARFFDFTSSLEEKEAKVAVIGKKGPKYIKERKGCSILNVRASSDRAILEEALGEIAGMFVDGFLKNEINEVFLLYSKFRRHLLGEANIVRLLPFVPDKDLAPRKKASQRDYIYEPAAYEVLESLIKEYIINQIRHGILESRAAEEMSRMMAMKAASENADEIISKTGLEYNKMRQTQITMELAEVIAAADAANA